MTTATTHREALPKGVVTFLFTDIENSSGWWETRPVEMRTSLAAHDALIAEVVAAHDGAVVKHLGDGCWGAFGSATNAAAAAIDFQFRHQAGASAGDLHLDVRIGLHTGEVEPTGGDYFGPVVNRAARIVDLANGNQIVCSSSCAALLTGFMLRSEGLHELRGIGIDEIHMLLSDTIVTDHQPLRRPVAPTNLPRPKTSLIGRDHDIERGLSFVLEEDSLVTLIGPGGVGKTRLAVEIGRQAIPRFRGQVHFCDLVPANDEDAVAEVIAEIVGARRQPGMDMIDSIADYLSGRETLVILDNCEHVIDTVREGVTRLLAVGGVHVLATSREALALADEQQVILAPLTAETDGVELFVDRARRRHHRFELNSANEAAVREVARRLDGIPLAIELAAARIRLMTPAEIAERLGDGLDVIDGGHGGDRHATLRTTVRWSYDLLASPEATMFKRLSVFTGGFDLAAAAAVCSDDVGVQSADVPELVMALLDKSMLASDEVDGHQRFRMLETLREFAVTELEADEGVASVQHRHAAHYCELARNESRRLFSPAEPDVWRTLDVEWSNLRTALDTFEGLGDLDSGAELVVSLVWFASMSMRFELFGWAEELLAADGIESHARYTDLCGAAAVGSYFTLDGQVAERAEAGLEADPSDPEGFCRCALASVFLNNVHTSEASDELTSSWLATDPQPVGSQMWAHGFRTFHLCIHEPGPAMAEHAKVLNDLAATTGSATVRATAAWANGQVQSFTDLQLAIRTWTDGREWARSLPSGHLLDQLLVGLLLHVTARRGELRSTLEGCREALAEALHQHYYAGVSHLFGVTAIALSRADDARTGARLVGAMMENGHLPRRNARRELEAALGDHLDDLIELGRSLSVTQAGHLAIGALDEAIERERGVTA
jgi:predicted ATPase/class 3 adenylate cyclase